MEDFIVKRTYKLDGLDCANCAAKIENAIAKLDGIGSVTVNFMTTKMTIEADESRMDDIVIKAAEIVKKIEPDTEMKRA